MNPRPRLPNRNPFENEDSITTNELLLILKLYNVSISFPYKTNLKKSCDNSRSEKTRNKAAEIDVCEVHHTVSSCVAGADLIILCVPVGAMQSTFKAAVPYLEKHAIVSDVGSVKSSVIKAIKPIIPKDIFFVPQFPHKTGKTLY